MVIRFKFKNSLDALADRYFDHKMIAFKDVVKKKVKTFQMLILMKLAIMRQKMLCTHLKYIILY